MAIQVPPVQGYLQELHSIKLNLTDAADKLSKLTTDRTSPVSLIRAGAAGKIPVYWFNDLKRTTYISDFTGDLSGTDYDGPLQLTHTSLRELAVADTVGVFEFQFTEQDFALLEKIKGTAVDDDGNLLGHRHPASKDGTVTASRDQLFVYAHDLNAYAAELAPVTVATAPGQGPVPATVNQAQKAVPRSKVQEDAIIAELKKQGYDPLALPKNPKGKPGIPAKLKDSLLGIHPFTTISIFDHALERLAKNGDIQYKK